MSRTKKGNHSAEPTRRGRNVIAGQIRLAEQNKKRIHGLTRHEMLQAAAALAPGER